MNGAPDWQDGECCFRCRTQFTLVARKHHCRNCGNIFCAKCSSQQIPLPKLNIEKNVRVCDGCYEKLSTKNEDPLTLAIDKNPEQEKPKTKVNSKSSGQSKSNSSNKPAASASAPSEQDLKEEEELQLALALSLSETPAKVSFPDCRQFEENNTKVAVVNNSNHVEQQIASNNNKSALKQSIAQSPVKTIEEPMYATIDKQAFQQHQQQQQQQQHLPNPTQTQYQLDQPALEGDQELFRFVAEIQSTTEVFTNRVNSNKLRNRPVANDSAIQSLFLKLTNMHAKLLEYIKIHDEERAGFESIQDKLSQISDARAALDALREEHQEKKRQEAAEAERLRQTQLASKLEMMRQKKSQMMQYQREVALQRIQAQEMMLRQPQGYQSPPSTSSQQTLQQQQQQPPTTTEPPKVQHDPQSTVIQSPSAFQLAFQTLNQSSIINSAPFQQQQQQQQPPSYHQHPQSDQLQQFIPRQIDQPPAAAVPQTVAAPIQTIPKPIEDEEPLISFDD